MNKLKPCKRMGQVSPRLSPSSPLTIDRSLVFPLEAGKQAEEADSRGIKYVNKVVCGEIHTLAIHKDDKLIATGHNGQGQLGNGTTTDIDTWTTVIAGGVKDAACGTYHSLVLKTDGTLWATGWNFKGQLGTGDTTGYLTWTEVLSGVKGIACGATSSMAIKDNGTLWVAGDNCWNQL